MDKTFQLQAQIRQNAEEVSSYLSDMLKWENEIEKKDKNFRRKSSQVLRQAKVRQGGGTVISNEQPVDLKPVDKNESDAKHTYDVRNFS